ncbi:MAG: lamin tail domain-containing protein [Verrucomicrobiales bacterium]
MWIVDNRAMPAQLLRERFILSQYDRNAMTGTGNTATYNYNFPRMSNHFFNCTVIINEEKVLYNGEIRKSGSPFTRDGDSNLWHGKWKLPADRYFRERRRSVIDPSGVNGESSGTPRFYDDRIARYFLYVMGHPTNEFEYVHQVINGDGFKLRENHEPIANDFMNRNWEDGSAGTLLRIDDEWRFTDDGGDARSSRNADWSYKNSDNPTRDQSEWIMRSREAENDYSTFIEWVRAVGTNNFDEQMINRMGNRDLLCINAAVRGYDADWDTITLNRGKNAYFYRPKDGSGWMLCHWDGDRVFGNANETVVGTLPGIRNYFDKPYIRRHLNYYFLELMDTHTSGSARTEAWMQAEIAATEGTGIPAAAEMDVYRNWFTARRAAVNNFINSGVGAGSLNAAFTITTGNAATSANTLTLSGNAPADVFAVRINGQPAADLTWTSTTGWTLSNILLQSGQNTFTVQGVDRFGSVLESSTFSIAKNGNAPPVMALDASSFRAPFGEPVDLDASASFDPDGTPLSFAWTPPPGLASFANGTPDTATAAFAAPGWYDFAVQGTDGGSGQSAVTREVAVYSGDGLSTFGGSKLEPFWQLNAIELRDNSPSGAWYSLNETEGRLTVHVLGDAPKPVSSAASLPTLTRALPETGDWSLETEVRMEAPLFADAEAGIVFDVVEGAFPARYVFALNDGEDLVVRRSNVLGGFADVFTQDLGAPLDVRLRARRDGAMLRFYRQGEPGEWIEVYSRSINAATTASAGGLYASTANAQDVRVSFDYALLIDPGSATDIGSVLRITEIMYDQASGVEFIELQNIGAVPINLGGVRFEEGNPFGEFTFPDLVLGPGEFVIVTNDLAAFEAQYGSGLNVAGQWSGGSLSNGGERIVVLDPAGNPIIDFSYDDEGGWPAFADGIGASLVNTNLAGDPGDPENWAGSADYGGTPGAGGLGGARDVVVNEVLTHTDLPQVDFIELHNMTGAPIDLGGWYLSDSAANLKKFQIPGGTMIAAGSYAVFDEDTLGFALDSAHGDEVYLSAADGSGAITRFADAVAFGAAFNGESLGRWPDATGDLYPMLAVTEGSANAGPRIGPVVISEVHYHPQSGDESHEFIEIYNPTAAAVDLTNWQLRGGADFDFAPGTMLGSGEALVVVPFDPADSVARAAFENAYGIGGAGVQIVGGYAPDQLANGGESVRLERPDDPPADEPGFFPHVTEDAVAYGDAAPWPDSADGGGDSLHRGNANLFGPLADSWAAAAPTPGNAQFASSYAAWAATWFLAPGDQGENEDPDKDGKVNLIEYAFGCNPTQPDLLPIAPSLDAGEFSITYPADTALADIAFGARSSTDLNGWSAAGVDESVVGSTGFMQTIRASVPAGDAGFLQVEIRKTSP